MMNFTGFGLNCDPPSAPNAVPPLVPFITLPDGTVVPLAVGDPSLGGPAPFRGQAPMGAGHSAQLPSVGPSGTAAGTTAATEGPMATDQRALTVPTVTKPPAASLKIRRPPNAFMVFANEHRKTLARAFPTENNQSISVRLGSMWKRLSEDTKAVYYRAAKQAAAEHKRLYPSYVYSPKEARIRKKERDLVKREKVARSVTDSPSTEPAGAGEGDTTSTETRAKLMEVAQLLNSISDQQPRQPPQPRRASTLLTSDGGPLTAETGTGVPSARTSDPPPPLDLRLAANSGPTPHAAAGCTQPHHTVSAASSRDVHWTVLPSSQASGVAILPSSQASGVAVLPPSQASGVAVLPPSQASGVAVLPPSQASGVAVLPPSQTSGVAVLPPSQPDPGGGPCVPCGQVVYHGVPTAPGGAQGGAIVSATCCPAGQQSHRNGGGCLLHGAVVRGPEQHWTIASSVPAVPCRPGTAHHHHLHGGNFVRPAIEPPCQPQLVSPAPATWTGYPRIAPVSTMSPSVLLAQPPTGPSGAGQSRPPGFCLHFPAGGYCSHCRPAVCCSTLPAACQCATAGSPRDPVINPPQYERYRRPPVQLRIPNPRPSQALHGSPAVNPRPCLKSATVTSPAGPPSGTQEGPAGGYWPWDSPPPAAYLRSAHSPNIEELVDNDADPLNL